MLTSRLFRIEIDKQMFFSYVHLISLIKSHFMHALALANRWRSQLNIFLEPRGIDTSVTCAIQTFIFVFLLFYEEIFVKQRDN